MIKLVNSIITELKAFRKASRRMELACYLLVAVVLGLLAYLLHKGGG